ncbi:MAG: chorismate synthase [Lachnospiraceae bacterium]|nr:chorismate synthase [Lachnospiraceae bacterium]
MSGSTTGNILKITTFGESHGEAVGVIIDGFPAGMELSEEDIIPYMDRRRPGKHAVSTARNEADTPQILSGVFEGMTTGAPIMILIRNTSQHSSDYAQLRDVFRPGHADYTFYQKYGIRDHRGGGRSSGRETAARVAAGAVCAKFLGILGIRVAAFTASIGSVAAKAGDDWEEVSRNTPTGMPDAEADFMAQEEIAKCRAEGDSLGGVIECRITGVPAGLGDPVFDKLDAALGKAMFSIGAVKAVEIGDGLRAAAVRGSENNDAFCVCAAGIGKKTNHAGGILGGISDGDEIRLRVYVKPTPSISKEQETVRKDGTGTLLTVQGRHDPVIVPRAVVVVESMCAVTILDALLVNMSATCSGIRRFYGAQD